MQVQGVPNGWRLAAFRRPKLGEFVIDSDGTPYRIEHDDVTDICPVICESERILEAAGRLRAWLRDFGDQKQPEFVTDLRTVLDCILKID